MSQTRLRRRPAPASLWLFLILLLALAIGLVVLVLIAWQRAQQVRTLLADVEALQVERQALLLTVEGRLAALEEQPAAGAHDLEALRASVVELQATMNGLQATVDDLAGQVAGLAQTGGEVAEPFPPQARLAVARQRQSHNLSCESSAASMAAQYHGVPLSEADILAALPRDDNPHLGFRGNVDGPTGGLEDYGVYAGPVMAVLSSHGLQARSIQGGLDGIRQAIARGNPVIAWVTYNCQPSSPTEVTINGESVTLVPWQHAVIIVGYSPEGVWANDPWDGQEDFYLNADVERALAYLGDMVIEVAGP